MKSEIITKATAALEEAIANELTKKDPTPEQATAILRGEKKSEDSKRDDRERSALGNE